MRIQDLAGSPARPERAVEAAGRTDRWRRSGPLLASDWVAWPNLGWLLDDVLIEGN